MNDIEKNNYSLFVNKYNIEKIEKVEGIEYKKLGDICKILEKGKRKSSEGKRTGKYPLFYCSILGNLWIDDYDFNDEGIMVNTTNGSGKCALYYCEKEYSVGESVIRFSSNNNECITKYIYYYLKNNKEMIEKLFKGSNQKQLPRNDLLNLEIPVPSIEKQVEIVKYCDNLTDTIDRIKNHNDDNALLMKNIIHIEINAPFLLM